MQDIDQLSPEVSCEAKQSRDKKPRTRGRLISNHIFLVRFLMLNKSCNLYICDIPHYLNRRAPMIDHNFGSPHFRYLFPAGSDSMTRMDHCLPNWELLANPFSRVSRELIPTFEMSSLSDIDS
jgi:hypothetical protein